MHSGTLITGSVDEVSFCVVAVDAAVALSTIVDDVAVGAVVLDAVAVRSAAVFTAAVYMSWLP